MVFADAIQAAIGPEPQSTRSGEAYCGVNSKHADEPPRGRVVFPDTGLSVAGCVGPLAGDHDVPVGSDGEIERAQFGVVDQTRRAQRSSLAEHGDRVLAFPGRTYAGGQIDLTAGTEAESPRERNDPVGKKGLSFAVETSRQGQDRPAPPQTDVVAAVGPERPPARVEPVHPPRVQDDLPVPVERQYPIVAAVEIHQLAGRVETETTRIGYPVIGAERSRQRALGGETEDRAVAVTIRSAGAGDQEPGHHQAPKAVPGAPKASPAFHSGAGRCNAAMTSRKSLRTDGSSHRRKPSCHLPPITASEAGDRLQ